MTLHDFVDTYHLKLNTQQMTAVQAVSGPVLLLAVPGSGKTTVLVSRLGYMIYSQGIAPEEILTITYTVSAAEDMKNRFRRLFNASDDLLSRMQFRTINGICASIIYQYGKAINKAPFELLNDEKDAPSIIGSIYREVTGDFALESDIRNVRTQITYIKNSMLSDSEIEKLSKKFDFDLLCIYKRYEEELKKRSLMDYDDQMIYALRILQRVPEFLSYYRDRFRYICVDEAQDTSKIQHEIIELLSASHQNLFMVGDEDQSIYGFRAACPEALLTFESRHPKAKILFMETNYRSDAAIVSAADRLIRHNEARRDKHMVSDRQEEHKVKIVKVNGRNAQYEYLLNEAIRIRTDSSKLKYDEPGNHEPESTAVLYRDNESALPLIDLLERKHISYRMRNADLSFFGSRIVNDIKSIILFAKDPCNTELFMQIYFKISTYLTKENALQACRISEENGISILDAAENYVDLPKGTYMRLRIVKDCLQKLKTDKASFAIKRIMETLSYQEYLDRMNLDRGKVDMLSAIAEREKTVYDLFERLDVLKELIRDKETERHCSFILSTIHSSKGLEYDRVYLIDAADGIFPEIQEPSKKNASVHVGAGGQFGNGGLTKMQAQREEAMAQFEEERRIFYVAVTRARNELYIIDFGEPCVFRTQMMKAPNENKRSTIPVKPVNETDLRYFLSGLSIGDHIRHIAFGRGILMDIEDHVLTVSFNGERRKIDAEICFKKGLISQE